MKQEKLKDIVVVIIFILFTCIVIQVVIPALEDRGIVIGNPTGEIEMSVQGMTCADCCNAVQSKLAEVSGVISAHADLEKQKALIRYRIYETNGDELVEYLNSETDYKASLDLH